MTIRALQFCVNQPAPPRYTGPRLIHKVEDRKAPGASVLPDSEMPLMDRILILLKGAPDWMSSAEVAEDLDCQTNTVRTYLGVMFKAGGVERQIVGRDRLYRRKAA